MKVWSQRYGRWLGLAAVALAVAASAVPTAGARPLGGLPCDPQCGTIEVQHGPGGPLAGGPSVVEMQQRHNSVPAIAAYAPPLSQLAKFSFAGPADPVVQPLYPITAPLSGPATVPTDATPVITDVPYGGPSLANFSKFSFEGPIGVTGYSPVLRPGDVPGGNGPVSLNPVVKQPLYPITAPLSGPATVPTDATPVTTDAPNGGTDWTAIGIAAGMGALLLGAAALIVGTSHRRQTPAQA
jgi:hypothetical protein